MRNEQWAGEPIAAPLGEAVRPDQREVFYYFPRRGAEEEIKNFDHEPHEPSRTCTFRILDNKQAVIDLKAIEEF